MTKKSLLVIVFICAILVFTYGCIPNWKKDGNQIEKMGLIDSDSLILVTSDETKDGGFMHKMKYGSDSKMECKLLSIDENGDVRTIAEVHNGYIQKFWREQNEIHILYNSGKDVYDNRNDKINIVTYPITEYSKTEEKYDELVNKRVVGVDQIDYQLLIEKENINFESQLASNIYCDENKRLYIDGNELREYTRSNGEIKSVLTVSAKKGNRYYIGYLQSKNQYVLVSQSIEGDTELFVLDSNYSILTNKMIDFEFNKICIGSENLILSNEYNSVICVSSNGEIKNLSLKSQNNQFIQCINYSESKNLYYIVTNSELFTVSTKDNIEIRETKLRTMIGNVRESESLS